MTKQRGASVSRRNFIRTSAALAGAAVVGRSLVHAETTPLHAPERSRRAAPNIVVIGAGAFGGWTALSLLRRGATVTLVDAWGAGNSRSSSGDETRIIRSFYNGSRPYTSMVTRAFTLWSDAEQRWRRQVYHRTGAIFMFEGDDSFAAASMPLCRLLPVEGSKGA